MRLDLINSRFPVKLGPRIYDSIEGELISGPTDSPKTASTVSFLSKQSRLEDEQSKKAWLPARFMSPIVDRHGSYIPVEKAAKVRASRKPGPTFEERHKTMKKFEILDSLGLGRMKRQYYDVKEDSVENRLKSGKLPGACWPKGGRNSTPPNQGIGPGEYDVYDTNVTYRGKDVRLGGQFNTQPSGREHDLQFDQDFLPLKERRRYLRKKAAEEKKIAKSIRKASSSKIVDALSMELDACDSTVSLDTCTSANQSNSGSPLRKVRDPPKSSLGGSGTKDRFDDRVYKTEFFVKTSGMKLSQDWDKPLDKRIPFSFQAPTHSPRKVHKSEGADVDVDVGHLYSIVHTAQKSPVKYSAAFRSSAPVGMEIPTPTSGVNIGPGSFPGAYPRALEVKRPDRPSHFILRGRPQHTRPPLPDLTEPQLPFSERHKAGPVFDRHKVGGGSVVLQAVVKEKMQQIYPKLAQQKFPPPPPPAPSPWARPKIK